MQFCLFFLSVSNVLLLNLVYRLNKRIEPKSDESTRDSDLDEVTGDEAL